LKWRAPVLAAFLIGLAIALTQKKVNLPKLDFSMTSPVWTSPTFSVGSFFYSNHSYIPDGDDNAKCTGNCAINGSQLSTSDKSNHPVGAIRINSSIKC